MEHKSFRFLDRETHQITISRDARFIELNNGTTSVEVPIVISDSSEKETKGMEDQDEEIKLLPFAEKQEEGSVGINGELGDAEQSEAGGMPRAIRSTRGVRPKHYDDFVVDLAAEVESCAVEEPSDYREAMQKIEWRNAMEDELASHAKNGTWELVPLPPGKKVVGSRWVFKIKRDEKNNIVKYKGRIVAQGFTQKFGDNFDDVFAPVVSHATLRTFLVVAAKQKLIVQHLDIKTAYLYGTLEDEIFMRQPPGCEVLGQEKLVCRLKRSIYGLRQSARCWNRRLKETLVKLRFKQS